MLKLREVEKGRQIAVHRISPVRKYLEDPIQRPRILRSREAIQKLLIYMNKNSDVHRFRTIVELGSGAGEITGFFSWGHFVHVYECAGEAISYARGRWKQVEVHVGNFEDSHPMPCDILVACEVMEHLEDPKRTLGKWLEKAKYAVISSPLKGDRETDLSSGQHLWSFDEEDFAAIAEAGGHEVLHVDPFQCGKYTINLIVTKKKEL